MTNYLPSTVHVAIAATVLILSLGGIFGFAVLVVHAVAALIVPAQLQAARDLRMFIMIAMLCALAQLPLISFALQARSP
jgi:hypothetical protein